jgi:DNA-directed RNA polymerase specialized sigma24 family protein
MILHPTADPYPEPFPWASSTLESTVDDPSETLARIGRGDADALGWFYDRWEAPVHAFVARLIRGPEAQERVVEAIFWAVWERAGSYDSTPVDQWVHALSIGCCRAELERHRMRSRGAAGRLAHPLRASASLRETHLLPVSKA